MKDARLDNYSFQKVISVVGVVLLAVKLWAWYLTNSVAILTDALESITNVLSGFIGLYSLYLSAQPKDNNHPYGHGKVEFISAAIEGTLISVAGIVIIYEAIDNLKNPHAFAKLDYGIVLVSLSAVVNYVLGRIAVRKGKASNSLALVASGKHLQTDTYSTIGIVVGLILMALTKQVWIDSVIALSFALFVLATGYKIVRSSVAGIMDEADDQLLEELVALLNKTRNERWIDLHNLRIIKYGSTLHLDCHITLPWYFNLHEAHQEIDQLRLVVKESFGESVELFIHTDGCLDFSCKVCSFAECPVRKSPFVKRVEWTVENISSDSKHGG